jgi:ectoine hydroxylase-related dioxygenase (phytanoyl-CoA dioxygenase family)
MNHLFKDIQKEEEFLNKGYTLLKFNSKETIQELSKLYSSYFKDSFESDKSFYYSLMNDYETNKRIQNDLSKILKEEYNAWFKDYETFSESFLVKKAHDTNELFLHQDWNYVDEFNSFSITIWIPLEDSFPENGGLFLIPGSHQFYKNYRSATLPTDRFQAIPQFKDNIQAINIKKGEVVAFHPGVFHGSFPNNQNYNRPVVATVVKKKSDPLVYVNKENNQVFKYSILADTFLKELSTLSLGHAPQNYKDKSPINYHHRNLSKEEFLQDIHNNSYD